jgi:ATP-dependent protease ClpP protease subunit
MRMNFGFSCLVGGVLLGLVGCQQPAAVTAQPEPVAVDGVGYILFNAAIVPSSRDMLIADMDRLVASGAHEIHLAINSPGGVIDSAQAIIDAMNRLHEQKAVTFKAYNIGTVASAASFVFLAAQDRYTAPKSAFLFHAPSAVANGPMNAESMREEADKLDAYERTMRAMLKARTRLTDADAMTYVRRTVVLGPDDARRDGVVDGIAVFTVPHGARAWAITTRPTAATAARPVTTPPQ